MATGTLESDALYVRRATGLVRELGITNNVLLNLAYLSFPLGFTYLTLVADVYPGSNIALGFLLTALLVLPSVLTYGLLASTMPRSGGDYLFISRALHPLLGFVVNGLLTLAVLSGFALIALFIPTFALPALFQSLTLITNNERWANIAADVASKGGQFGIAAGVILIMGLVALLGLRSVKIVTSILMGLSLLGVAVTIGVLLTIDSGQFDQAFSQYGSVDAVLADAQAAGFEYPGFSFAATLAAFLFLYGTLAYSSVSTYWSGEVRQARFSSVPIVLITLGMAAGLFALVAVLAQRAFGTEFMGAADYVAVVDPDSWPLQSAAFLNLFIAVAQPHIWIVVLLGVTYVAGVMVLGAPTFLLATRNIFAYAFDRVVPGRLAHVSERTHAPMEATVLSILLCLIFLTMYVYLFDSQIIIVVAIGTLANLSIFFIVAVAGVVFPYRQPELAATSPINARVVGLPVMSVVAGISAIIMFTFVMVLMFSHWGTSVGARNPAGLKGIAVTIVLLVAIWLIGWYRARRSGLSLLEVQKTLPPE